MEELFKNKKKKGGVGVTDLINQLVQVFKRKLVQLRDNIQKLKKVGELNLVKLQNKGQLSYIIKFKIYKIFKIQERDILSQYNILIYQTLL